MLWLLLTAALSVWTNQNTAYLLTITATLLPSFRSGPAHEKSSAQEICHVFENHPLIGIVLQVLSSYPYRLTQAWV